jgi:multidrug efflux system outer membrane protein
VRKLCGIAVAVAMAACSFAPEYKRPEAGVPSQHRFAQPGEVASIADLPWWQVFKDPVLQDLIRAAIANNQDLALAAARVEESRATVGIAKADFYPQVSAALNASYGRLNGTESGLFSAIGNVSWELDLWGRIRNQRDAAIADLIATEDGRRAVILSLVSSVAQAYV